MGGGQWYPKEWNLSVSWGQQLGLSLAPLSSCYILHPQKALEVPFSLPCLTFAVIAFLLAFSFWSYLQMCIPSLACFPDTVMSFKSLSIHGFHLHPFLFVSIHLRRAQAVGPTDFPVWISPAQRSIFLYALLFWRTSAWGHEVSVGSHWQDSTGD